MEKEGYLDPWLLDGDPTIGYKALIQLGRRSRDNSDVMLARENLLNDPKFKKIVDDVKVWPWPAMTNHKSADHPVHKLIFLSSFGLTAKELDLEETLEKVIDRRDEDGLFQIPIRIKPGYGGTDTEIFSWMLCDTPLVTTALVRLGLNERKEVTGAVKKMMSMTSKNGWPCTISKSLGKFRGPGKKEDPCPYSNLIMLQLLAEIPEYVNSSESRQGAEVALELWSQSRTRHPYMFFMGTDFRKLKAPLIWYDIMHLADVLTRFPWLKKDERLNEIVSLISSKSDKEGRYTPESVWTAWKDWDFGQKKIPSRWLTLEAQLIVNRYFGK
jgi:hypothetical protein